MNFSLVCEHYIIIIVIVFYFIINVVDHNISKWVQLVNFLFFLE